MFSSGNVSGSATYYTHFDSFAEALQEAGFPAAPGQYRSKAYLLDSLREWADELGRPPISEERRQEGPHSPGTYRRHFGSWERALDAAGLATE